MTVDVSRLTPLFSVLSVMRDWRFILGQPKQKRTTAWIVLPDLQVLIPAHYGRQAGTWSLLLSPVNLTGSEPSDAIT